MDIRRAFEAAGLAIDAVGVGVIVVAIGIAIVAFARGVRRNEPFDNSYRQLRQSIGRGILLGLEFLVAGDIIRTVAITPTFISVGVLGLIVVIRTFLSFALEGSSRAAGHGTLSPERVPGLMQEPLNAISPRRCHLPITAGLRRGQTLSGRQIGLALSVDRCHE